MKCSCMMCVLGWWRMWCTTIRNSASTHGRTASQKLLPFRAIIALGAPWNCGSGNAKQLHGGANQLCHLQIGRVKVESGRMKMQSSRVKMQNGRVQMHTAVMR